ncbi:MAG: cytidine deaminase [Fimbriimonadaceae bacterium]|nr:cytidine deaminase [Fimbriimonadaceae bacterium]
MNKELTPEEQELLEAARTVRGNAHCPESGYAVGAALRDDAGRVHVGVNVENASYGLTVCAERNAVGAMAASGGRRILQVAVVTRDGGSPCGACRQVLMEFAPDDPSGLVILCHAADSGKTERHTMADLLPHAFRLHR